MKKISMFGLFILVTLFTVAVFPDPVMARVFRVFGPEDFVRSGGGPATEVLQFPVQYPDGSDFTLHIFYAAGGSDTAGAVSSALVTLNGRAVVTPDEFSRNVGYIRKPVTLTEGNSLSVELRGKPGSGMRVVITGRNDDPQQFDVRESVQPDGSNLFGPDMGYLWTIIDKPTGARAVLSDASSASPTLSVDSTGEYIMELRIFGGSWESRPILVKLAAKGGAMATLYNTFVPVPIRTRVVAGVGDRYQDYSIQIGSNTYTAPAPVSCGSPGNSGFQVLVLDRATLVKRDHRSFNMPCGRDAMTIFLAGLDDTSMVIVSSLYTLDLFGTCFSGSLCTLLRDFGGTTTLSSATPGSFTMPGGGTAMFSYSLIGIPHLGAFGGTELNNWDHKPFTMSSKIYSNIEGSLVYENINRKWTFVHPEFVEIETSANASETENTIKVGGVSFGSFPLTMMGAAGGFQVLVLEKDTLREFPWFMGANNTFFTNCGSGAGSLSEAEQKRMYDFLHNWTLSGDPQQQYVVVIAGIGVPIDYKATYFPYLVRLIGNYYGGTIGVLNQLGSNSRYSLVGMTRPGFAAYPVGATDSVEANSTVETLNLRAVMHKDRQGWFKPAVTDKATAGAAPSQGRPDFSLLSVALQPYTPWPLPNPSHLQYGEEVAAYQYISRNLGAGAVADSDIRSIYTGGSTTPDTWLMFCNYPLLKYENIPAAERNFPAGVYDAVWQQLCGTDGEFNYLNQVNAFKADLDIALLSMQASSNPDLANVYEMVREAIPVESGSQVLYDAGMVLRGLLTAATSVIPDPLVKGGMGALNGILTIAMTFSKKPAGPDYTAIDTAFSSLSTEMNNLWVNCQSGSHTLLDIVKSDWGKLRYVAKKLTTALDAPPEAGGPGWYYQDGDPDLWVQGIRGSLEAHYVQSLLPAVFRIGYLDNTPIFPDPKNYCYGYGCGYNTCHCLVYCWAPDSAYWIDQFPGGRYSWYVLEDWKLPAANRCGMVEFGHSDELRDVLFGKGPWCDDAGCHGVKLNLSKPVFFQRWLPNSAYSPPPLPDMISWEEHEPCYTCPIHN